MVSRGGRLVAIATLGVGSLFAEAAVAKTKIACVGASTTSGDGSTAGHHYPDELQRLVAPDGEVRNFGASGTTMLRNVSATYWTTSQFALALAYEPDVAIIWFGGNDAKPENWTTHKGEFLGDYEAMIRMFQGLPSHPRTYVILSLLTRDTEGIPKAVVDDEVIPLVRQAAAETGSGVVDVHDELANHPEYFPDGIHPNDMGTVAVAKLVFAAISAASPDAGVDARDAASADVPLATDATDAAVDERVAVSDAAGASADASVSQADAAAPDGAPSAADTIASDAMSGARDAKSGAGGPKVGSSPSSGGGCDLSAGSPASALGSLAVSLIIVAYAVARAKTPRSVQRSP